MRRERGGRKEKHEDKRKERKKRNGEKELMSQVSK
jgi:hypothetical protein